ncbi:MAG: arginine N-succinyltransferase, partial [Herminiimonas sp.]|nr:arginine N-succinyltransferase [Herminiimonas sp.]
MSLARPAAAADIPALVALAAEPAPGVRTAPVSAAAIERAVERSIASFASAARIRGEETYLFVLESPIDGSVIASATISATAGATGPFFAFRNDVIHQVSRDLDISHSVAALTLCSNLTGYSQLSGFALRCPHRTEPQAALLSRARLLFAATAPHRFGERFFASLAGVTEDDVRSPFWDALGKKFFKMDFAAAERVTDGTRNRALIVELMPHYPVYVPLLPADAQAAMGQVGADSELPYRLLTEEGFTADEFIDIFDGGPILCAHRNALRSFSASSICRVAPQVQMVPDAVPDTVPDATPGVTPHLICTMREEQFRAILLDYVPM